MRAAAPKRYNSRVCCCPYRAATRTRRSDSPLKTRPIRILLLSQAIATVAFAAIGGLWAGGHGAVSGALGGLVNLVANFVYALMGDIVRPATAIGALFLIMRAEGFEVAMVWSS